MHNKRVKLFPGILVKTNENIEHWFHDQNANDKHIPENSILVFLYKVLGEERERSYRTEYRFLLNGKEIIIYWSFDEADLGYLERNLTEIIL